MNDNLRCPIKTCSGWVCEINQDPNDIFWGCGECGNVWYQRLLLDNAITSITTSYPYRKNVYKKIDNHWQAVNIDLEPKNYTELVAQEWNE